MICKPAFVGKAVINSLFCFFVIWILGQYQPSTGNVMQSKVCQSPIVFTIWHMHWKCLAAEIKIDCPLNVSYLLSHIRVRMQLFHSQVRVWMTLFDAGDCFFWRAFGKWHSSKGIWEIALHLGKDEAEWNLKSKLESRVPGSMQSYSDILQVKRKDPLVAFSPW